VWLRVNPGFGHGHSRKTNTGGEWSKHGIWHDSLDTAFQLIAKHELDLVGLHMHIGSGSDFEHLEQVCDAMVRQVRAAGVDLRAISGGGGLPIPYRPDEQRIDCRALFEIWNAARLEIEAILGHRVSLEIEPGRFLVGESGLLVARVWSCKRQGENIFCTVDAGFDNLLRPAMYGSHHEISVVKADGAAAVNAAPHPTVVSGPLCESGDVFTQEEGGVVVPRQLPPIEPGDLAVLHDAGAYASSMASNYNSRGLAPEILLDAGETRLIRRRQTIQDLIDLEELPSAD
jgi:diaminopimelate decarboxylase